VSFPFNSQRGLVVVQAEVFGPSASIVLRLALDTGATATMINVAPLVSVGYDPSLVSHRVQVTTGSGVEFVPKIDIVKIEFSGRNAFNSQC
jgi:hypothetical protein